MASLNTPKLYSLATMQAFLDGSLDTETQTDVEKLLAENPDYAFAMEGLDRNQSESLSQRNTDQEAFKEYLTTLGASQDEDKVASFEEPLVRDLRSARWWQIAAVILILVLPLIYVFQKPKPTVDQMAMNYLEPYMFSGTRGAETQTFLISVRDTYEVGRSRFEKDPKASQTEAPAEFEVAKQGYIQILSLSIDSLGTQQYLEAKMGLGNILLFQGYPAEALAQFEPIIQQGDNIWLPAANWYKVWSLIRLDRIEEAKTILVALSRQRGDYRSKAQALLDEL